MSTSVLFVLCFLFTGGNGACHTCGNIDSQSSSYSHQSYHASSDHIENPGRGFYKTFEVHASKYRALHIESLDEVRKNDGVNIALREYILDSFVNHHISSSFLQNIHNDLSVIKSAGWTVVLRFQYTSQERSSPPYGDAAKSYMLAHIQQLSPIWKEFEGVISALQAGFIGTWGEWAYSTYFGDSHHPDPHGVHGLSAKNWQDRKDVLKAIMDNAPKSIHVQVRVPTFKTEIWKTQTPTRLHDEEEQNYVGRTGHHNDCFLASDSDFGTYDDITKEKHYLELDSLFVPVGGETCAVSSSKNGVIRSDCPTALKELKRFHWSFLNMDYNKDVLNRWKSQSCYNEVHKNLGYRLSLKQSSLSKTVRRGDNLCFHIAMSSTGFAAPYKPWSVRLVLKPHNGGHYYSAVVPNVLSQAWLPGNEHVIDGSLTVPAHMPEGSYQAYLAIYDEKMKTHADYYILLANTGVPDFSSGLNDLQVSVQVSGSHSSNTGCPTLAAWSPPTHSKYSRVFGSGHGSTGTGTGTSTGSGSCRAVTVPNHSFENTHDHNWSKYTSGYSYTSSDKHTGSHAISVTDGGAWRQFKFSPAIHKFTVTAYSKRHGSSTRHDDSDYSLYCDLLQSDGSHDYGEHKAFDQHNHSWQEAVLHVNNAKGITSANCFLLYRHFTDGSALFDDVTFNADC